MSKVKAEKIVVEAASFGGSYPLSKLHCDQHAVITSFLDGTDESIMHRLALLGFAPGREITLVRQAPLGGPMVFRVCGAEMCLRQAQAELIRITTDSSETTTVGDSELDAQAA